MKGKPLFSSEQVIDISDLQSKWSSVVEPKLHKVLFLMMFADLEPKVAILSYDKFEEFWRKANEATELQLKMELLYRILENEKSGENLVSFADLILKTDITATELEMAPDVKLETD